MLRDESGRAVILCNNCPARLDLGPSAAARHRNRMPSMWFGVGGDQHLCPQCSAVKLASFRAPRTGTLV
jgi:hypothetical protein